MTTAILSTAPIASLKAAVPSIIAGLDSSILAIAPDRYDAFKDAFLRFAENPDQMLAADTRLSPRVAGQIAVIPLSGFIIHHAGIDRWYSGVTSTEAFAHAFDDAMGNPDVGAIVIDCDSNGGTVEGVPELADRIFAARGKGKKIVSVVNAHCNSAAYFACSQADEVVITPSGEAGSIGVYTVHLDFSGSDAQYGIKRTVVSAGLYKAEGVAGPLSAPAEEALRQRCLAIYGLFTAAVARGRDVTPEEVESGFGQGRVLAAQDAVNAGIADRIGTLNDVLADLAGKNQPAARGRRAAAATQPLEIAAVDSAAMMAGADQTTIIVPRGATTKHIARALSALVADDEKCPTCDTTMVDDGEGELECPDCDGAEVEATSKEANASGSGTPAPKSVPASPAVPTTPAHQARSHSVNEEELAALRAAAATEARDAEQARQRDIRALCEEHTIEASVMNGFLDKGTSFEAATKETIRLNREKRAAAGVVLRVGATREEQKPWTTFGEFATAVMDAGAPSAPVTDVRLFGAASGINQATPSEGGFLVPPSYSQQIWGEVLQDPDSLMSMTDDYPVEGESLTLPAVDEKTRADGTIFGGVIAYWLNEADQATKSKPKWRAARLEPQELAVLIYATDKSLRNSPAALQTFLQRAAVGAINFKVGNAIVNGIGSGQPTGWTQSPAMITVAKESGQANTTIVRENISKMWARLHPRARTGAVWLMNVECEPQLDDLNQTVKNVAGTENVGGYASKIYDPEKNTLKGRPIMFIEYAEALGTKNDIQLVNPKWYFTGTRGAGIRTEVSIHVRFEYAEQAFRFMYEIDGQPAINAPITPFKGANTLSAFVNLANR